MADFKMAAVKFMDCDGIHGVPNHANSHLTNTVLVSNLILQFSLNQIPILRYSTIE